jgi:hypothetical protein
MVSFIMPLLCVENNGYLDVVSSEMSEAFVFVFV